MSVFIWNMAISFQLLFIIISSAIFIYTRDKTFKFYALYNIFLTFYVLSRNEPNFSNFENFVVQFIGTENANVFVEILNFYIQIVFYSFYSLFALYFLDLNKHRKKFFKSAVRLLEILPTIFFIFGIICFFLRNSSLYLSSFTFLYLPAMLILFAISVKYALKDSGSHKNFFLIGVCSFVFFALVAFAGSNLSFLDMQNPIGFFFIGIIIETIFFSLGLAFKIKLMNDEKIRVRNLVTKHRHQQQIGKINGLLEGEERERKRIAEELHDGIACDLTAIKINLAIINQQNKNESSKGILSELSEIIEKSCVQIREISHNLSPSSITNYGLLIATENFCKKVESLYHLQINFSSRGDRIDIEDQSKMHIYRIIQELVNNIVKHSKATVANVEINYDFPVIVVIVNDNGKGFSAKEVRKGIGLSNIESRIRFLDAKLIQFSDKNGTSYSIEINVKRIHKNQ